MSCGNTIGNKFIICGEGGNYCSDRCASEATREPVVWADEASPFTGVQVKALLEENEALRRQVRSTDYPIPTLRNEVWNAALAGVAQSNKTQAEYEAFHAFMVWCAAQKRSDGT